MTESYECPICSFEGPFNPAGLANRANAQCPKCGSLERHRSMYFHILSLARSVGEGGYVLHFTPEPCYKNIFNGPGLFKYVTSGLKSGDLPCDMQDIPLPDNTVDLLITSHVLEHVPDDRKAMREIARVLKANGKAVISVPVVIRTETIEGIEADNDESRLRCYGHPDHRRAYGPDVRDRLRESGLTVEEINAEYEFGPEAVKRFNLDRAPFFVCGKTVQ